MPIKETWECDICHTIVKDPSPDQVKDWRKLAIRYITLDKTWETEQLVEDQPLLCGDCLAFIKEKLDV